jgi:sigma-70-like protein
MDENEWLANRFEEHRAHLRAVAYRMLALPPHVLDTLAPAERLAFVLHDLFEVPFEEIAPMVGRTPAAARQLASRARRRVKDADRPGPDPERFRRIAAAVLTEE